jgi:hypothetical protein
MTAFQLPKLYSAEDDYKQLTTKDLESGDYD